ncbi:MAG: phosphatase PAP2 family protein [Chloroflexota bacterium]|nr:phosphatase PAP2 family protein [Chloroflexota bacterium]
MGTRTPAPDAIGGELAGDGVSPSPFGEPDGSTAAPRFRGTLVVVIFLAYMAIAAGLYMRYGVSFTPDRWLFLLLIGALVMGRAMVFLRDWIPVVLLIAGYEVMRKLAWQLVEQQDRYVHVQELIDADRAIFGGELPTLWLQGRLYTPGQVHWYDYVAMLFYALHFVFPLAFAFLLWLTHKACFWQFTLGFLVMTYAAFAFFLWYPAGPPWFAERYGYLSGVQWPFDQAFDAMAPRRYDNLDTFRIWDNVSGNPVAAMPSLHASFPWLVLLFAVKFYGRRGLFFLPYSPILWFSVVYLGHHWVVDVLAGVAWATVSFVFIQFVWPWLAKEFRLPVPAPVREHIARWGSVVARPAAVLTGPWSRARSRSVSAPSSHRGGPPPR